MLQNFRKPENIYVWLFSKVENNKQVITKRNKRGSAVIEKFKKNESMN